MPLQNVNLFIYFNYLLTEAGSGSDGDSMDGGVIAGIICAVIAVLLAIVLFICWWRYPHWFLKREKPFNYFIKVEMQNDTLNHSSRRVSRLDSTASESQENTVRYVSKNTAPSGGADVTACPIYASIGDNIENEATANGNVQGTRKLYRHGSDIKPLKKG